MTAREVFERLECFLQILVDQYSPHITGTLARGMMCGICFADPRFAARVARRALEQGLIVGRSGPRDEIVMCLVPLPIIEEQMNEALFLLACSIALEFGAFESPAEQHHASQSAP